MPKLSAWLDEWYADQLLAQVSVPGDFGPTLDAPTNEPEDEPAPACGDIRLLAPDSKVAGSRPILIAILEAAGKHKWLVAPFSRFATPATPGELHTDLESTGLTVLCVWNATRLSKSLVQQSWQVDAIDDGLFSDVQSMLQHITDETELEPELADRVGPPIQHPADPRHTYVAEEMARMEQLQNPDTEPLIYPIRAEEEAALPLAADTRLAYGIPSRYRIADTALTLRLVLDRSGDGCVIFVDDADGRASEALDGARVATDTASAAIEEGCARLSIDSIGSGLTVALSDGTRMNVTPDDS